MLGTKLRYLVDMGEEEKDHIDKEMRNLLGVVEGKGIHIVAVTVVDIYDQPAPSIPKQALPVCSSITVASITAVLRAGLVEVDLDPTITIRSNFCLKAPVNQ